MKKEYSKSIYIAMCVAFVISLGVLGISLSYAFFEADIVGNYTETKIETGKFDIETSLTTISAINVSNISLIDEENIETEASSINFTAKSKSTTNKAGKFNIYLKDITISNNLIDNSFKWQLVMNNNIIASGDFSDIETKGNKSTTQMDTEDLKYFDNYYLKTAIDFNDFNQSDFSIRVYLLNNGLNQNHLMNGSFECKAAIEAYSIK